RLPEYAAKMKPVIPDYEWITYGERVTVQLKRGYAGLSNGAAGGDGAKDDTSAIVIAQSKGCQF
ncbi:hypothetical protein, partial [Pseudomonas cerasi]